MKEVKLHNNEIKLIKECVETCKHFTYKVDLYNRIINKMDKLSK